MAFSASDRDRLEKLLCRDSVKTGHFQLASGQTSSVYVDIKQTTLTGEGALLVGRALWDVIAKLPTGVAASGGLTLGADPLVTAIAIAAHQQGQSCAAVIVRKSAKSHGTMQFLEAPNTLKPGNHIVAVDDVITTAGSTIKAINHLRDAGFVVEHAVCVVDREAGGQDALEAIGVQLHSLYKLSELLPEN